MLKLLKLAIAPVRYPLKLAAFAGAAVLGAMTLGEEIQPVRAAVSRLIGSTSVHQPAFDPAIAEDPVRELEFLHDLDEGLRPQITEARTLIRKRRAEIEYSRELARFVEQRVPAGELVALRDIASSMGEEAEAQIPSELSAAGRSWLGYQRKVANLEVELERLLILDGRVEALYAKLDRRRGETQGLVPESVVEPVAGEEGLRTTPEMSEAEALLGSVHESLFKALYTLSPELVEPAAGTPGPH